MLLLNTLKLTSTINTDHTTRPMPLACLIVWDYYGLPSAMKTCKSTDETRLWKIQESCGTAKITRPAQKRLRHFCQKYMTPRLKITHLRPTWSLPKTCLHKKRSITTPGPLD